MADKGVFVQQLSFIEPDVPLLRPSQLERCSGHTVVIDTETTGLYWWEHRPIGVGVWCPLAGVTGYIPTPYLHEVLAVADEVRRWSSDTIVVMHNAKFDCHMLGVSPRRCGWRLLDTTVLVHLDDPRNYKALGSASEKFLGEKTKAEFVAKYSRGGKLLHHQWPMWALAEYCVNDCRLTYELAKILYPKIVRNGMRELLDRQMAYIGVLWEMERLGMQLNLPLVEESVGLLKANQGKMEKDLYDAVGHTFNWQSHEELSHVLYEEMGLEKPKDPFVKADGSKSKHAEGGKYNSTCTSTFLLMEKVKHPLGFMVLDLRETNKLRKTLEDWQGLADDDGVIHTNFNVTGTRTGRLSSSEPNFQNIPSEFRNRETQSVYSGGSIRADEYNLRRNIVARPGTSFVAVDYKQMEMRMFGLVAGDERMMESLRAGRDIHADVAERVWGVRDSLHREWSKTIGFGLIYGMTTGSLMFRLNMTHEQATAVTDQYWRAYPRIKPWLMGVIRQCKRDGYVTYWSKRRWYEEQEDELFKGANALIQGGSADLLMTAVLRVADAIDAGEFPDCKAVSLVHDEQDFEIPLALQKDYIPRLCKICEVPDIFEVPFFTDVKTGVLYSPMQKWEG